MRVALVVSSGQAESAGGRHVLDLAAGLGPWEVEATILALAPGNLPDRAREAGVEVEAVAFRGPLDRAGARALARRLEAGRFDAVHLHGERALFWGAWAARKASTPLVVATIHGSLRRTTSWSVPRRRLFRAAIRWASNRWVDRVVAVSAAMKREMSVEGLPGERAVVIPNGIRLPTPEERERARKEGGALRRRLGLESARVAVYVGRLEPEKGIRELAAAWGRVRRPDRALVVAGTGPLAAALPPDATALGRVEEIWPVLAMADAFVLPSPWESFGLALLEAMATGRACVACAGSGPEEVLGDAGLLVRPGDPEALAAALERLFEDPGLREELGARALARSAAFSRERMAESVARLYRGEL